MDMFVIDARLGEVVMRVFVAACLGAAIGFERELGGHPAGLKTHTLVAAGSAIFGLAGSMAWGESFDQDPTRVAAQVVSGIGFVGAGAILRDGFGVRGLTTAATLWASGALGLMAVQAGLPLLGGLLLLLLVMLAILRRIGALANRLSRCDVGVTVTYERGHGTVGPIVSIVTGSESRIEWMDVDDSHRESGQCIRRVCMRLSVPKQALDLVDRSLDALRSRSEVIDVSMSTLAEDS